MKLTFQGSFKSAVFRIIYWYSKKAIKCSQISYLDYNSDSNESRYFKARTKELSLQMGLINSS